MKQKNIVMGNQSTMAEDDYPNCPPGFKLSNTRKYKLEKLEREVHFCDLLYEPVTTICKYYIRIVLFRICYWFLKLVAF